MKQTKTTADQIRRRLFVGTLRENEYNLLVAGAWAQEGALLSKTFES